MYESPIDIIYSDMQMKLENEVCKAVQNVGINVNKDELIKALSYDRQQYEKGYADAKTEQQWIPISSNPITTGLYLVLCNEWGKNRYRICAYYSEVGKWIENGKNITKSITHWMPLPEPWKGEKNECTD